MCAHTCVQACALCICTVYTCVYTVCAHMHVCTVYMYCVYVCVFCMCSCQMLIPASADVRQGFTEEVIFELCPKG